MKKLSIFLSITITLCALSRTSLSYDPTPELFVNDLPFRATLKIGNPKNGNLYTLSYVKVLDVKAGERYLVTSSTQLSNNLRNGKSVLFSSILTAHSKLRTYYHQPLGAYASYIGEIAPWSATNITYEMHHYGRTQVGIWQADEDYPAVYFVLSAASASANRFIRKSELTVDNAVLQATKIGG